MTDKARDEVMPMLASGVSNALLDIYGKELEFVLIVMIPDQDQEGYVQCSTITGIKDARKMRLLAKHLEAMADQQDSGLNPDDDDDIGGHA